MKLTENQRVARNPVTGDPLESRMPTDEYRAGWDRIFGKKKEAAPAEPQGSAAAPQDSEDKNGL